MSFQQDKLCRSSSFRFLFGGELQFREALGKVPMPVLRATAAAIRSRLAQVFAKRLWVTAVLHLGLGVVLSARWWWRQRAPAPAGAYAARRDSAGGRRRLRRLPPLLAELVRRPGIFDPPVVAGAAVCAGLISIERNEGSGRAEKACYLAAFGALESLGFCKSPNRAKRQLDGKSSRTAFWQERGIQPVRSPFDTQFTEASYQT